MVFTHNTALLSRGDMWKHIVDSIRFEMDKGRREFIIYPYGSIGSLTDYILQNVYHIKPLALADDILSTSNSQIIHSSSLKFKDLGNAKVLFTAISNQHLLYRLNDLVGEDNVINIFSIYQDQRIKFIKQLADTIHARRLEGNVAECGVYQGATAYYINKFFPDRRLYLFDSFASFSPDDIKTELNYTKASYFQNKRFSDTSADYVYNRMPNKAMVEIHKGYIPHTLKDIDDTFCFVNLDMDLYQPTYQALDFFYPRISGGGGVILLHDYFWPNCPGIKCALDDYEKKIGKQLYKITIGDNLSMALIKI